MRADLAKRKIETLASVPTACSLMSVNSKQTNECTPSPDLGHPHIHIYVLGCKIILQELVYFGVFLF